MTKTTTRPADAPALFLLSILGIVLLLAPGAHAEEGDVMQGDNMEKEEDAMDKGDDAMEKETEEDPSIGVFAFLVALVGGLAVARRL